MGGQYIVNKGLFQILLISLSFYILVILPNLVTVSHLTRNYYFYKIKRTRSVIGDRRISMSLKLYTDHVTSLT